MPDCPPIAIVASLPIDLGADHGDGLGNDRIDLARHDAGARLQGRQLDLANAGQRPGIHPAQIVRDFGQADRQDAQLTGRLDRRVLAAQPSNLEPRRNGMPVCSLSKTATLSPKSGCALMPVPTAVPPCAKLHEALHRVAQTLDRVIDLRAPAVEFLAQRYRHRIHQVRAAGLDDVAVSSAFFSSASTDAATPAAAVRESPSPR